MKSLPYFYTLILLASVFFAKAETNDPVGWEEAIILSKESNKNIIVRFTASWCQPCRVFEASVWNDKDVQSVLNMNFITVKADFDNATDQHLFQRFNINVIPTFIILDSDQRLIIHSDGALGKTKFLSMLEAYKLPNKNDLDNMSNVSSDEVLENDPGKKSHTDAEHPNKQTADNMPLDNTSDFSSDNSTGRI